MISYIHDQVLYLKPFIVIHDLYYILSLCDLFRNTYVQNNRYVNDSLGYMVLDCINTHISSPHLRAEIHKSVSSVLDCINTHIFSPYLRAEIHKSVSNVLDCINTRVASHYVRAVIHTSVGAWSFAINSLAISLIYYQPHFLSIQYHASSHDWLLISLVRLYAGGRGLKVFSPPV